MHGVNLDRTTHAIMTTSAEDVPLMRHHPYDRFVSPVPYPGSRQAVSCSQRGFASSLRGAMIGRSSAP